MADEFGDRMKEYEAVSEEMLTKRLPIIMRLDGRAFHTLTRKLEFEKPFDQNLHRTMVGITMMLCDEICNARYGYTQSDEISILIYPKYTTSGYWFDNRVQKMVSVAASLASSLFTMNHPPHTLGATIPSFDARAYVLPVGEVPNYFWWRQSDAIRNSILGLGQAHYSSSELHGVGTREIVEKLRKDHNLDWEKIPWDQKWGTGVRHKEDGGRFGWMAESIPKFTEAKGFFEEFLQEPTFPGAL